jgi:hypothetical protein
VPLLVMLSLLLLLLLIMENIHFMSVEILR